MRKSFFKAPVLSGPVFERSRDGMIKVMANDEAGAHYSVYHLDYRQVAPGRVEQDSVLGMESFKAFMEGADLNSETFVLYSTSGVHGSYTSLEDIEASLEKFGDMPIDFGDEPEPDGYRNPDLTVLIIQPRLVCMRCGNVRVTKADIPFLKQIRDLTKEVVVQYL